MLYYLRNKYYWVAMHRTVDEIVHQCDICQKGKISASPHVARFQSIRPTKPNQVLAMDIIGPMPLKSDSGLTYILTVVDYFDNFVKYIPCTSDSAFQVYLALVNHWFFCEGIPEQIVCDRGSHFTAAMQRANAELFQYRLKFTTPYSPRSNGLAERFNRRYRSLMRTLALEQQKESDNFEWWHFSQTISYINNITVCNKTGLSPWMVRRCTQPIDIPHYLENIERTLTRQDFKHPRYFRYLKYQRKAFKQVRVISRKNWNRYLKNKSKLYYSKLTQRQRSLLNKANLTIGSTVMIKNVTKSGIVKDKLRAPYRGPYLVLGRTVGNNSYKVKDLSTGHIDYVNVRHMKFINRNINDISKDNSDLNGRNPLQNKLKPQQTETTTQDKLQSTVKIRNKKRGKLELDSDSDTLSLNSAITTNSL